MTTLNIQTTATAKKLESLKAFLHSIDPQTIIQESPLSPQDTLELHIESISNIKIIPLHST